MATEQTKTSEVASETNQVGVFSNTEVDVIISRNAISTKSDNKEQLINEVVKTLTPLVKEFVANAAKVTEETVSDMVAVIWDEWKKMSDLEKILVAIATAMVVGAVGYAAGCGSSQVISGNWDTIKTTAQHAMKSLGQISAELLKKLNSNVVVKKLQAPFEQKLETSSVKIDDVKKLVTMGHGAVIMAVLAGLPLFAMGVHKLGELEDETKAAVKKIRE